tara:strand:+ start:129 stop:830 length:702 start_codon:yes stop_codon:yes gene_type:complete
MNYGEIERQTFRTFLAFSALLVTVLLIFFNITSNIYRVSNITYINDTDLSKASIESLKGTSIWLVDDTYFDSVYLANPSVEKISIIKELPNTLVVNVTISEKIAFIQDNRQSPPRTFIIHKNLYIDDVKSNTDLISLKINNGPVKEGFYEELVTFVLTLKKYSINISNVDMEFDGTSILAKHFNTNIDLGDPSDLARKASVVGYYLTEETCSGEIRLVYSEEGNTIRAVTNCK